MPQVLSNSSLRTDIIENDRLFYGEQAPGLNRPTEKTGIAVSGFFGRLFGRSIEVTLEGQRPISINRNSAKNFLFTAEERKEKITDEKLIARVREYYTNTAIRVSGNNLTVAQNTPSERLTAWLSARGGICPESTPDRVRQSLSNLTNITHSNVQTIENIIRDNLNLNLIVRPPTPSASSTTVTTAASSTISATDARHSLVRVESGAVIVPDNITGNQLIEELRLKNADPNTQWNTEIYSINDNDDSDRTLIEAADQPLSTIINTATNNGRSIHVYNHRIPGEAMGGYYVVYTQSMVSSSDSNIPVVTPVVVASSEDNNIPRPPDDIPSDFSSTAVVAPDPDASVIPDAPDAPDAPVAPNASATPPPPNSQQRQAQRDQRPPPPQGGDFMGELGNVLLGRQQGQGGTPPPRAPSATASRPVATESPALRRRRAIATAIPSNALTNTQITIPRNITIADLRDWLSRNASFGSGYDKIFSRATASSSLSEIASSHAADRTTRIDSLLGSNANSLVVTTRQGRNLTIVLGNEITLP